METKSDLELCEESIARYERHAKEAFQRAAQMSANDVQALERDVLKPLKEARALRGRLLKAGQRK